MSCLLPSLLAGPRIRPRPLGLAGWVLVGTAFGVMPAAAQDTSRVDQATLAGMWTGRRLALRAGPVPTYELNLTHTGTAVAGTVLRLVDGRSQEAIYVAGELRDNRLRLADRQDALLLVGALKGDRIRARVTRALTGRGNAGEQASNQPGAGNDYEFRRLP